MKSRIILLFAALSMLAFVSCEKDEAAPVSGLKHLKITASILQDNPQTKLALGETADGKTKVGWSTGDAFSLTIGEEDYVFEWLSGNLFEYNGDNGDIPATLSAGTVTATYPATAAADFAVQSGTEAEVGKYMQMAASLDVTEGQSTEGLNLTFGHMTSVVHIKLSNSAFVDKQLSISLNATGLLGTGADAISTAAPLTANNEGVVEAWFAVPATEDELSDWHISVGCDNDYYYTPLGNRQLVVGKLYNVDKSDLVKTHSISKVSEKYFTTTYEFDHYTVYHYIGLYAWAKAAEAADAPVDYKYYPVHLTLEADIQLPVDGISVTDGKPSASNWIPVSQSYGYMGKVDGKNHIVKGLRICKESGANAGFFARIDGIDVSGREHWMIGTVKNLKFDDAVIYGHHITGVLAGSAAVVDVLNCHITNSTVNTPVDEVDFDKGKYAGGLFGNVSGKNDQPWLYMKSNISNCSFSGSVKGLGNVGGIAGSISGKAAISKCTNSGTIAAKSHDAGGIVGYMIPTDGYPSIVECTNSGKITCFGFGQNSGIGGIAGFMGEGARIVACTNEGEVSAYLGDYSYLGGIVGKIDDDPTYTFNTSYSPTLVAACINKSINIRGNIMNHYGGIVGSVNYSNGNVRGCYTVQSTDNGDLYGAKGVYGSNSAGTVDGCYHSADPTDNSQKVDNMNAALKTGHEAVIDMAASRQPSNSTLQQKIISIAGCEYHWTWESGDYPLWAAGLAD